MFNRNKNVNTPGQFWRYLLFLFAFAGLGLLLKPNFISRGPGYDTMSISANLKQIDAAKEVWTIEHHATGAVLLALNDLPDFLGRETRERIERPRFGEIYRIMPLGVSPEAELTKEVDGRPKGTILRLSGGSLDVVLPGSSK